MVAAVEGTDESQSGVWVRGFDISVATDFGLCLNGG